MRLQGLQLLQQLARSQCSYNGQWRPGLQQCAANLLQACSTSSALPEGLAWRAYSQGSAAQAEGVPAAGEAASAGSAGSTGLSSSASSSNVRGTPVSDTAPPTDGKSSHKAPSIANSSSNGSGSGSNRRSSNSDGTGASLQGNQRQGQQRSRNRSGGPPGKQGSSQPLRAPQEVAGSSSTGRPRSAAERALQELSGTLCMAEAQGQFPTLIAVFDKYLEEHWAEGQLAPEYLPSIQSRLYHKYKTALCRRPKWITKARLQRCEALDQQYGKEEQVQRTNILRMLLKHHRGEYTQSLAIFRQLWDDRVVLLAGREVEAGLQAAYHCKDVELVTEVLETIRERRYLITMTQLGVLLKGALRYLAITAIQQDDMKALHQHLQGLSDLTYATGSSSSSGGGGGEADKWVHEDHYIFQDLIAAAADANRDALAGQLLKVVDATYKERDATGKLVPIKFPQGLLLSVLNCCARKGASSTASQVVWPLLQRCLQQPPYQMSGPAAATQASSSSSSTGKNGKEKQRQPQQPSAAAYHALIEAHMRGGHLEPALEAMAELQVVHGGKDPLAVSVYGGLRFCIEQLNDEAQVVQLFNAVTKRQEHKQVITNSMFNLLVRAVARSSSAEDTATIWSSMPAYGLTPDADSYNAVIENLAIVKRTLPMLRIMETMQQQHDKLRAAAAADPPAGGVQVDCRPNAATFQLIIQAMLDSKDLLSLGDVLQRLRMSNLANQLPHSLLEEARSGRQPSAARGNASRAADSSSSKGRRSGSSSDEEQSGGGSSSKTKWAWKPGHRPGDDSSSSSSSAAISSSSGHGQSALNALREKFRAHSKAATTSSPGASSEGGGTATADAGAPGSQKDEVGDAELDSLAAAIKGGMK